MQQLEFNFSNKKTPNWVNHKFWSEVNIKALQYDVIGKVQEFLIKDEIALVAKMKTLGLGLKPIDLDKIAGNIYPGVSVGCSVSQETETKIPYQYAIRFMVGASNLMEWPDAFNKQHLIENVEHYCFGEKADFLYHPSTKIYITKSQTYFDSYCITIQSSVNHPDLYLVTEGCEIPMKWPAKKTAG